MCRRLASPTVDARAATGATGAANHVREAGPGMRDKPTHLLSMRVRARKLIRLALLACLVALPALIAGPATANPAGSNGQLLFARYDPNLDDTVLHTINPDGSHDQQVVPFAVECPHWSPDGTRIAACGTVSHLPGPDTGGATIIDADTGSYREIRGPDPELTTACYVWSPDAKRLACESWSDEEFIGEMNDPTRNGIYTIRVSDGQGLTRMTSNPYGDDVPMAYSPNGKRLVFARYDENGDSLGLFVVKTNGTGLRQIAPAGVTCCSAGWSPQGNNIVFSRHVTPDVHSSIWIVHFDGTGLREVPAHPAYGCGGPNSDPNAGGCFDPRWSPDGEQIVFGNGSGDLGRNVYTVRPDGSGLHQVTHGDAGQSNEQPDWGPHPLG
jgi:WD40-like Beta Propeller Repeat